MASKGSRGISYQGTGKIEAGYKLSHTTETLIGYIASYGLGFFLFHFFRQFSLYPNFLLCNTSFHQLSRSIII